MTSSSRKKKEDVQPGDTVRLVLGRTSNSKLHEVGTLPDDIGIVDNVIRIDKYKSEVMVSWRGGRPFVFWHCRL